MKFILLLLVTIISFIFSPMHENPSSFSEKIILSKPKLDSCFFGNKKLYGKVQLVQFKSDADLTVQIVNNDADIKIKFVESFADKCGEWQIVPFNADLKVYITESCPDLKIQFVSFSPGLIK